MPAWLRGSRGNENLLNPVPFRSIPLSNDVEIPAEIQALPETRWQARLAKNWAESDRLRAELSEKGWNMEDGKDSYVLEPA